MKKAWNKASRVISALLVLGMFASVVPAQALAVDEPNSQVEQQDEEQAVEEPSVEKLQDNEEEQGDASEQATAESANTPASAGASEEETVPEEEPSAEQPGVQKARAAQPYALMMLDDTNGEYTVEIAIHDVNVDWLPPYKHDVKKTTVTLSEEELEEYLRMDTVTLANTLTGRTDFVSGDFYAYAYQQPAWKCEDGSWSVALYTWNWDAFANMDGTVSRETGAPWLNIVGEGLYEIQNRGLVPVAYWYKKGLHWYPGKLEKGQTFSTNSAWGSIIFFVKVDEGNTIEINFSEGTDGEYCPIEELPANIKHNFAYEIKCAKNSGYNYAFYYTKWVGEANRWFQVTMKPEEPTTDPVTEYELTYDANGGVGTIDPVKAASNVEVTVDNGKGLSYENHTFTGWNTEKNGSGTAYTAGQKIYLSQDLKLYAQWKEDEQPLPTEVGYTINYYKDTTDSSNWLGEETGSGKIGDSIEYTSGKFLPDGYTTSNMKVSGATIIGSEADENVLNVVYGRRTDLSYTVYYIEDQTARTLAGPDTVSGQTYGANITVWAKDIPGYTLTSDKNPQVVNIGTGENKITFYYKAVGPDQPVVTPSDTTTTTAPAAAAAPVTPRITTPAAGGTGTGTAGTTGPTVTAAPADGDGDNAAEEPEEEVVPEEETPQAQEPADESIADEETPLAGSTASGWALLNLILAILTVIGAIVLVVGYFAGYQNIWRLLSLIPAIGGVVAFFMTEDMSLPMAFVDGWTVLMVIIAVVQIVVAVMALKNKDEDEDENA